MIEKIISGGQTGADRAALDCAIEHGIPHGGWCPKGRLAEDCPIDARYQLQETPGSSYLQRTEWNVRDTDGTVIFSITPGLSGGSKKTLDLAKKRNKPVLHLSRHGGPASPETELLRFIRANRIMVLNVAGPRASKGSLTRCLKPSEARWLRIHPMIIGLVSVLIGSTDWREVEAFCAAATLGGRRFRREHSRRRTETARKIKGGSNKRHNKASHRMRLFPFQTARFGSRSRRR